MKPRKVFGIGFHKTGTKSLAQALHLLGYKVTGPNEVYNPRIAEVVHDVARALAETHDAFQDNPWPLLYREMDQAFPGSRFILTLRPTEKWIASVVSHFGRDDTPMRQWIYGVGHPAGNEDIFVQRYERHNREVRAYFAQRPGDLLEISITEGDGWEKLCPFLGVPVPARAFPKANTAADRGRRRPAGA